MKEIEIKPARAEDLQQILDLLKSADLPWQDAHQHLPHFLVARAKNEIVGTVGLEVNGPGGLLRSLAVRREFRGLGLGKALYQSIVREARRKGIHELGLLTTTAEGFFAKAGFQKLPRDRAPEFVTSSLEFRELCSSSAIYMRMIL